MSHVLVISCAERCFLPGGWRYIYPQGYKLNRPCSVAPSQEATSAQTEYVMKSEPQRLLGVLQ